MKRILSLLIIFFPLLTSFGQVSKNDKVKDVYRISGTIKGAEKTEVFLAYYFGSNQQVIRDTVMSDASGHFVFQGKEDLPEGLYLVSFLKTKYLDFIIGEKDFSFETDTTDLIGSMKISNSVNNQQFYLFQKEMARQIANLKKLDPKKLASAEGNNLRSSIKSFQDQRLEKNKS